MKKAERLEKIIQLLQLGKPLRLEDFLENCKDFEKKTLISDLNELVDEKMLIKEGIEKNTTYKLNERLSKLYEQCSTKQTINYFKELFLDELKNFFN